MKKKHTSIEREVVNQEARASPVSSLQIHKRGASLPLVLKHPKKVRFNENIGLCVVVDRQASTDQPETEKKLLHARLGKSNSTSCVPDSSFGYSDAVLTGDFIVATPSNKTVHNLTNDSSKLLPPGGIIVRDDNIVGHDLANSKNSSFASHISKTENCDKLALTSFHRVVSDDQVIPKESHSNECCSTHIQEISHSSIPQEPHSLEACTKANPNKPIMPTEMDVLCGRGGGISNRPGNRRFQALVTVHSSRYAHASAGQKREITKAVIETLQNLEPPGRFLKKDDATGFWHDVGMEKAQAKVGQALRETSSKGKKASQQIMNAIYSSKQLTKMYQCMTNPYGCANGD